MEKRTIEIQAKTGAAETDLEKIASILEGIADKMDSASDSMEDGFKDIKKGADDTKKSIFSFGNLFKAGGVFALAEKALSFVTDAFKETQVGADLLQVSQEALSRVMNDFFTFLSDNIGTVTGFFKSIFEDPRTAISNLVRTIKENLIERVRSAIEVFGFLGQAISAVFKGDFDAAAEAAKNAGKEMVDVFTGVDNTFDKTADAVVEYGKQVIVSAKKSVELQRQAEKLEAVNQGLIESYDIQAESLRQVRDDETKSIDDRLTANEKLKGVLEEQEKVMKANAQAIVDAAQARFNSTGLQEDEIALIQAKNELSAVEARVTGMMSEQLTNENSLRKEKLELMNELQLIGKDEFEKQIAEADQLREKRITDIEREVTDETMRKQLLLAVEQDFQTALDDIEQQKADLAEKKRQEDFAREQAVTQAKIDMAGQALGALQGLAKEGSDASKALAVGQVLLDAFKAIQATFANAAANPTSILFPGYPFVQAAIAGVTAFANVRKIMAVDPQRPTTPSAPSNGGRGAPSFNVVGAAPENQLAETIGQKEQKPIKAFVVSNEVSNQQELDRNITEEASIG
tara:strand:- start:697 stop:2418 length:1722 start_codon:yes stop_codon:yes gene_type:complete